MQAWGYCVISNLTMDKGRFQTLVFVYYIPHTLKVELSNFLVSISLASLGYGSLLLHFISAATFALQF